MSKAAIRYCILFLCLFPLSAKAQISVVLPDSVKNSIAAVPEAQRDTIYRKWGNYYYARYTDDGMNKALDCYLAALKIARKYNHQEVVRMSYFDIGSVYDAMNVLVKAHDYYELFYQEQLTTHDPRRIFRSAYNLANIAAKARNSTEVSKYVSVMKDYLKKINDTGYLKRGNLVMANLMHRNHDTAQFLSYYKLLPADPGFKDEELAYGRLYAEASSNYLLLNGQGAAALEPLYKELAITRDSISLLTVLVGQLEQLGDYKGAFLTKKILEKRHRIKPV